MRPVGHLGIPVLELARARGCLQTVDVLLSANVVCLEQRVLELESRLARARAEHQRMGDRVELVARRLGQERNPVP